LILPSGVGFVRWVEGEAGSGNGREARAVEEERGARRRFE
jgi:hypothetical protein